jgi:pimeloyl-ACP methyl ester carboxylesterase
MFLSVTCSEDAPGITRASITSAARALPAPLRADYSAQWVRTLHDCGIWHVPAADPAQKQPVTSDIPTMILEGQDDPITPPQYGADVAKTLSHGFSFVYPGVGHGAQYTDTCPYTMTLAFLRDPATKPPDACITAMTGP